MNRKAIAKKFNRYVAKSRFGGHIASFFTSIKHSQNKVYKSYISEDKPTIFAFKINDWKREFIKRSYPEYNWVFAGMVEKENAYKCLIKKAKNPVFLIWGYKEQKSITRFAEKNYIPVWRMEDGFIRSIGLGANHTLPLSLAIDRSGHLYFDPRGESDLEQSILNEKLLSTQIEEAKVCIEKIKKNGISKYNTKSDLEGKEYYDSYAKKKAKQKRILVIGQVEDDASILLGGCGYDNGKLVAEARFKNPDAQIFFKVHPDVLAGKRLIKTPLSEIQNIAHIIETPMSISKSLESIDEVYTISSLAGFEALIHGKKVVVAGQPFYSSYGLTEDLNPVDRRIKNNANIKNLSEEELLNHVFYCSYIKYPKYFNIFNGRKITTEEAINMIATGKQLQAEREARATLFPAKQELKDEEAENQEQ